MHLENEYRTSLDDLSIVGKNIVYKPNNKPHTFKEDQEIVDLVRKNLEDSREKRLNLTISQVNNLESFREYIQEKEIKTQELQNNNFSWKNKHDPIPDPDLERVLYPSELF